MAKLRNMDIGLLVDTISSEQRAVYIAPDGKLKTQRFIANYITGIQLPD